MSKSRILSFLRPRHAAFAASALAAILHGGTASAANEITLCDFSSAANVTSQLELNADANAVGNVLRLVADKENRRGSAYSSTPLTLTATTSFATHFRLNMHPATGLPGGSGIIFSIQGKSPSAVGSSGFQMGFNGVKPSVGVEFDITQNDNAGDINDNHVAIIRDGDVSTHLAQAQPSFSMENVKFDAWIDYDAATKTLRVYVATSSMKPATPLITHVLATSVFAEVGATAYVGFSGATGAEKNNLDVEYWVFSTGATVTECANCTSDSQCVASPLTPACQPAGFCGQCSATNSTQCTLTNPVCDTLVGECRGCSGNLGTASPYPCTSPTAPVCNAAGACVQCSPTSSALCTGATPVCGATGTCIPCTGDFGGAGATCPSTAPLCKAGSCTVCTGPADCTASLSGAICNTATGACTKTCTNDNNCGANNSGRICEPVTVADAGATNLCIDGCRGSGGNDCPTGFTCSSTTAVAGTCSPTDTDGDGIPDNVEDAIGTNKALNDSDSDGILDGVETNGGLPIDTDSDGTIDALDTDSDDDGLLDKLENEQTIKDIDGDGIPNFRDADDDGDGIPTAVEISDTEALSGADDAGVLNGRDLDNDLKNNWYDNDADGDGVTDGVEGRGDVDNDTVLDYLDPTTAVGSDGGVDAQTGDGAVVPSDATAGDTSVGDTSVGDGTVVDTSVADTTVADTTVVDTGGSADGALTDSAVIDATDNDAAFDDAGSLEGGGCNCSTPKSAGAGALAPLALALGLALSRRRRR